MGWDGVDRQLFARFTIIIAAALLLYDRLDRDPQILGMGIFFMIVGIAMVPPGPQPPD